MVTSDGVFGDGLPEETTFEQIKITKHSWSHKTHGDLEKSLSCREVSTISEKQKPVQYQNLKGLLKDRLRGLTPRISYSVELVWNQKLHLSQVSRDANSAGTTRSKLVYHIHQESVA